MASKKVKDLVLTVRVNPDTRRDFVAKAAAFGGASFVLHSFIVAFLEGRAHIEQPAHIKELYK